MRKIGIYGGTFDPVHHAHLILARQAKEELELEQVIFVPATVSPFKESPAAPAELRVKMLQAAIRDEPSFIVDELELHRPPPSYTVDSIEEFAGLPRWHRFEDLKKMVEFVVLNRSGQGPLHPYRKIERLVDIAATEIRKRVASGRSIRYLVPSEVEMIIREGNLYRGQQS